MTDEALLICTICARGGSKGVPSKNTREIGGKPLFVHSVEQARATGLFHTIAVSSDDLELLALAEAHGVDVAVVRPPELATDAAAKLPAIQHCVYEVERRLGVRFGIMVDLSATSPLRLPSDISDCVELLRSTGAGNVITVAPARNSPYFSVVEALEGGGVKICKEPDTPVVRRQDAPPCFDMNGSIYVWTSEAFRDGAKLFGPASRMHVMPEGRSLDIDTPTDWSIVEIMMARDARR